MAQKSEIEEQLRLESEFARRLLEADENTRPKLYGRVYDHIYEISLRRRGPEEEDQQFGSTPYMFPILTRLSRPGDQVIEVGCGSRFEELSDTLAEAMAHGLPAVSFDCDTGPWGMIHHDVDGHFVPSRVEGSMGPYGITRTSKALLFPGGLAFSLAMNFVELLLTVSIALVRSTMMYLLGKKA